MKQRRNYTFAFFTIALTIAVAPFCLAQNKKAIDDLVNKLVNTKTTSFYRFKTFSRIGFPAVASLINQIDNRMKGFVGYDGTDHMSNIGIFINFNYTGIRAAYEIEYLLSDRSKPRIYNYCVIVRRSNGKPIMKELSADDMEKLKDIYKQWWTKHSGETDKQLRDEWKKGVRPLSGTAYSWV